MGAAVFDFCELVFDFLGAAFREPFFETGDFLLFFLLIFCEDWTFFDDFDDDMGRKPEGKEITITISHIS